MVRVVYIRYIATGPVDSDLSEIFDRVEIGSKYFLAGPQERNGYHEAYVYKNDRDGNEVSAENHDLHVIRGLFSRIASVEIIASDIREEKF